MFLHDLLARRVRADGSAPFLTGYTAGQAIGGPHRTELSVRSFANWVAKTANLIADEGELSPGDRLELRLNRNQPGHWMTMVWTMAAWQSGVAVVDSAGDLVVDGPDPGPAPDGVPAYACSLHPLGVGLAAPPAGWADFSNAALAQPDDWFGDGPESADELAWEVAGRRLTYAEVAAVAPSAARVLLVDPTDAWAAAESALAAPLLGGGSCVVAVALDETALARIAADEKVGP
ncbi:MAG: TIGR03089 family protein [Propionibacteriaceae bacterium]|nr:TIGR03089 family protein [Propionibacteriaceae bacterium]